MPAWFLASLWGLVSGAALLLGAAVAQRFALSNRAIAFVMAFGSGVLISALSFELVLEAFKQGGFGATSVGFLLGALCFSVANWLLSARGAKHRKRSGDQQPSEAETSGSGMAIAMGALLDGIPESIAIGLTLLAGEGVSIAMVVAIFISNIPEGLSSSAGMKHAGRTTRFIYGLWAAIAIASGVAALAGYTLFGSLSVLAQAGTTAFAAGAILTMLVDTMVPEAFEGSHDYAGLIAALGFLCAFALSTMG